MPKDHSFLIHDVDPPPVPGTHVLAIGVGRYPWLVNGDAAKPFEKHQNLGQLTSPPHSARDVAHWFRDEFHNPERPIASVALLTSEEGGDPEHAATIGNIVKAVEEWYRRCDSDAKNLPIFYFCGHGLAAGGLLSLLAEDFGSNELSPLKGALDFNRLQIGMARCRPRQQVFLVDACRTDAKLTVTANGFAGEVPIQPDDSIAWTERPIFYSTLKGLAAYGRAERSHFADALLAAFKGTGSDDSASEDEWRVNTDGLHEALHQHMRRKIEAGLASAQIAPAENLTTFDLHVLRGKPRVPVFVTCSPAAAAAQGQLHVGATGTDPLAPAPPAVEGVWEVVLEAGSYDFEARFGPGPFKTVRRTGFEVRPPQRKPKPLEVV